jgi:hypothetical protein
VIAKIIPSIYDVTGRPVAPVTKKRKMLFHGTFPAGCYVSQPLSKQCSDIKELRQFLSECKYVSDKEQFNRRDYWMPPEEFEKRKRGDCDDFALWTWRQLMNMGYKARYVVGRSGKYGAGHAWVTIEASGAHFIVEPLAWYVGDTLPRLSTIRYEPEGSIEWDGKRLRYFVHEKPESSLPILAFVSAIGEWLLFWTWFWLRFAWRVCLFPFSLLKKFFRKRISSAGTCEGQSMPEA